MNYTGLEKHTIEELSRMAYGSSNRLAVELTKRIEGLQPRQTPYHEDIEAAALRGVGVNPIPLNIGEEA